MNKLNLRLFAIVSLAFTASTFNACSSSNDNNAGNDNGQGGSKGGGGGSESSGGKGGGGGSARNAGQSGNASGGAAGGSAGNNAGGTGGVAATGGASMGGSGMGGAVGAGGAVGTGGMTTPPAAAGLYFFTGKSDKMEKLSSADPAAGYFYAGGDANATSGAEMIATADATGLPPEMMFALSGKGASGLTILGVNFRANDGMKWRFFDASAFAGLSFWARSLKPLALNTTVVDAENTSPEDKGGTCTAMAEMCKPVSGVQIILTPKWKQFKMAWSDFVDGGPVAPASLARIDWLTFQQGSTVDFFITGLKLATAAELQ